MAHQYTQITQQLEIQRDAGERAIAQLSHHLAQESTLREHADQEQMSTFIALTTQLGDSVKSIADMQAHAEQAQVERARQAEETEAQWHRQQQKALDQLRIHLRAEMQEQVAIIQQTWQQRFDEIQTRDSSPELSPPILVELMFLF